MCFFPTFAQSTFQKCLGGRNNEEAKEHLQLSDGCILIAGSTYSFGAGSYDGYLVKTDPSGNLLWSRTYGTSMNELFNDILATPDGGYLLAGACSYSGNSTTALYLVKTDADGFVQWSKTYYDANLHNDIKKIIATPDGGFLCVGRDQYYIPVFKIDASGNLLFSFKYDINGSGISLGESVVATPDGGFMLTGYVRNNAYLNDLFLLKLNASGGILWTKKYSGGSAGSMYGNDLLLLSDGSFVITGYSDAFGAGKTDALLMKTDAQGTLQWIRAYGGTEYDATNSLALTCDGGFILSGSSTSFKNGIEDIILLKTNATGQLLWSKGYGGLLFEESACITTNASCDLILSGTTLSFGNGGSELFLLKLNALGEDVVTCTITDLHPVETIPGITESVSDINFSNWNEQLDFSNSVSTPSTLQSDSVCKTCVPPEADFDFVQNIMTVHFLNYSTNGITYLWDFGDHTTDRDSSPVHHFSAPGNYTIRLITTNECGADTIVKNISLAITDYCHYNIQPGPSRGQDADVNSRIAYRNENRPKTPYAGTVTWTWAGEEASARSLLKFDLSAVCDLTSLIGANLSLFYPTGVGLGGYLHDYDNQFSIYRITDDWQLNTITWNNQPAYTTTNAIALPVTPKFGSIRGLDITTLIKDMLTTNNYGFITKLETEEAYRGAMFGTSDWPIASERPLLQLVFNPLYAAVSFTDTIICPGDSLQLNASGGIRYKWFPAEGLSCTDCPNPKALPESNTEYTVYVYSCENCAEIKKINVGYPLPLQIDHHQEYICKSDSVQLITANLSNCQWSPAIGINNASLASPTVSPAQTTVYKVTALSPQGCPFNDSITVIVNAPPQFSTDTSLCENTTLEINLSENGGTYLWSDGSTNAYFTVPDTGVYWVEVTNLCGIKRDSLHMKHCCENLNVTTLFENTNLTHCFEDGPLELNAPWGNTFSWNGTPTPHSTITTHTPGWYVLTAYDDYGCWVQDSLLVSEQCDPVLFIPKAFSPNGDGNNDFFEIFGKHFTNFELKIFNRWGEIIYLSKDKTHFWNGLYREEEMPIGTYPWTIEYESSFDAEAPRKKLKGAVTLIR